MEHTHHDEMMPPTRKSQASTSRTLSSSSTKTPTEQITENFHANDAASSCDEVDVSSEKGPPTIDGSSEEYHDNSFANENPIPLGPSAYPTPPLAPINSKEELYSTKFYADGTLPDLPICGLCSQNSNNEEIGKMPHFNQQEEIPANYSPNESECPDYDEDDDDDEIYIITHDENSMVSGVTLPSDVWTVSSSVINNFEFSSPMPPFSNLHQKQILSPLSESGSELLHSETLQPSSPPPPSSSASSEPVLGNEQDPQIHHLSRLISQQEELLEKTRQLNDKRKLLVYSNIALIIAVALAVGLALGLGRSGNQNDNNQIEGGNYSDTSTQQNEMDFSDHHPSESPSNDPLDDQGNPPVTIDDTLCYPVEVYAEMLSENDLASIAGETVSWSIHDKLTNTKLRSGFFEPDSVFYGLDEGVGVVLENSFCLPNGSFSFQVDRTPFLNNASNPEIYLALRTQDGTFNEDEFDKPEILVSVEIKDELAAKDFSIPSSVNLPSIQPSTHKPTMNPATSTPSSLSSTAPSTHPSVRPSEMTLPELSNTPSSYLLEDHSIIPSSQSSSMPIADHVDVFLCYQVGFEITADDIASNVSVSVVTIPPADGSSGNPSSTYTNVVKMILFESGALEPNSSIQYNECLPPSEYSVIILSNGDDACCRGHYVLSVETELSRNFVPSPLSTIRNDTVVNSWDVTTFPLPFNSSSLNVLEIVASFISYNSSNNTNDDFSWELLHNGEEVASTNSFPYNPIADHSAYREMKYLSTGEYQFIGHNVQVGSFRLTTFDDYSEFRVRGSQIISTAVRNVHFHSVTFSLPMDMNQNHLLEVYFETPSSYGPEIYWEVRSASDESTVLTNFSPYDSYGRYLEAKYLSPGSYVFVVYDFTSQGLGDIGHFELLLDGDTMHKFDSGTSKSWYQYDFSFEVS